MVTLLNPNYAPSVFPSAIPIADYPNLPLSPDPYLLPGTSPSGPYIIPYYILDNVLPPQDCHQYHPQKEYLEAPSLLPTRLQAWVHPQLKFFFRSLQHILPNNII